MSEQQKFDGMSVDIYEGRFSGSFECDNADTAEVKLDDELYYLVRVRTVGAKVDETKTGDLRRTNFYNVSDAVRIDNNTGLKLATARNIQLALPNGLDDEENEVL